MLNLIIQDERGQDLIEYGLLMAFISVAALATVKLLSDPVNAMYKSIQDAFA